MTTATVTQHEASVHPVVTLTACKECAYQAVGEAIEESGRDFLAVFHYSAYIWGRPLEEWENWSDEFDESYSGSFNSDEDFAEDLADQTGLLEAIPENLRCYFDFEKFARDLLMGDYWEVKGHYFRNL